MPTYKSYCWSLGTTSFRMVEFNRKIEKQLEFLRDFWANPAFSNQPWSENEPVQIAYYEFLKGNGFIEGEGGGVARTGNDAHEVGAEATAHSGPFVRLRKGRNHQVDHARGAKTRRKDARRDDDAEDLGVQRLPFQAERVNK